MINVAIIEDDIKAAETLKGFAEKYGQENGLQIAATLFDNALSFLNNYKPVFDLVFMDIMLPDVNGFEAAQRLRNFDKSVLLIFVTNLQQFAVKGYEVDALDFIVKPVFYQGFSVKMGKAVSLIKQKEKKEIFVKRFGGLSKIAVSSVCYIEVIGHKIILHTFGGEIECGGSLSEFETKLEGEYFVRCNNCYLVSLRHVVSIDKYDVIMANGDVLKISQPKKKSFMTAFANWLGKGNYL